MCLGPEPSTEFKSGMFVGRFQLHREIALEQVEVMIVELEGRDESLQQRLRLAQVLLSEIPRAYIRDEVKRLLDLVEASKRA